MKAIAVIGAAGIVGKKVIEELLADPQVPEIVAIDRKKMHFASPKVQKIHLDIRRQTFSSEIEKCSSVIYLVEDRLRRSDSDAATDSLKSTLAEVKAAGCENFILLSSAFVYGAYADNPVPLTEQQRPRPIPSFSHGTIKILLEKVATQWASDSNRTLAVLRPVTTVSESRMSWISNVVRHATSIRSVDVESPFQFLHVDDLASALAFAAKNQLSSVFNVAPDGWIGADSFASISLKPEDTFFSGRFRGGYLKWQKLLGNSKVIVGLEPYINFSWVVSNGKLRQQGWEPQYSNEEAFVLSKPNPRWKNTLQRHRQEIALTAVITLIATLLTSVFFLWRRFLRK